MLKGQGCWKQQALELFPWHQRLSHKMDYECYDYEYKIYTSFFTFSLTCFCLSLFNSSSKRSLKFPCIARAVKQVRKCLCQISPTLLQSSIWLSPPQNKSEITVIGSESSEEKRQAWRSKFAAALRQLHDDYMARLDQVHLVSLRVVRGRNRRFRLGLIPSMLAGMSFCWVNSGDKRRKIW